MENTNKKTWTKPEIIELSSDNTNAGATYWPSERIKGSVSIGPVS